MKEKQPIPMGAVDHLKRLGRILFIIMVRLAVVSLGLMLAGAIYESIAETVENQTIPLVGQMVDIGGYRLHISCAGTGGPTVVIDSGVGDWSTSWVGVQAEVAKTTRACVYDRAGYGWSEVGPQPRTSAQFVYELHALLQGANINGPYVVVGHSLGGLTAQLFAHDYPEEVAGVVLVDSLNPGNVHQDPATIKTPERSAFGPEFDPARTGTHRYHAVGHATARLHSAPVSRRAESKTGILIPPRLFPDPSRRVPGISRKPRTGQRRAEPGQYALNCFITRPAEHSC